MKYKEFYMEDEYFYFDKKKLTLKFISRYYRFGTPSEIEGIVSYDEDIAILLSDTKDSTDFNIIFKYNREIKNSGFRLDVDAEKEVVIEASDERGIRNGYTEFCNHIKKTSKGIYVPKLIINHEPTLKLSGIIEGFYGTPWTHENRLDCIRFIGQECMNTYMYAPKDDVYHRDKWRILYPECKVLEFKEMINECKKNHIEFYYMIAPGKDFDFTIEDEYIALKSKLMQLIKLGISNFGVLMDDIEYRISDQTKRKFPTPAHAQAYIVNNIYYFLKENLEDFSLVMCPTEYDIDYDTPYLHTLGKNLLSEIKVFWTGNETLSHRITKESFENIQSILNHDIIIWDNIPVNDFEKDKEFIFIAPYENRSPYLSSNNLDGIVLNPMDKWEASKFTLASFAQYAWNANDFRGKDDFKKAIQRVIGAEFTEDMYILSQYFRNSRVSSSLPFYLFDMLNQRDVDGIDNELNKLWNATNRIKSIKSNTLVDSIMPWLLRIEREKNLWKTFKSGDIEEVKKQIEVLNKESYKVPANLVIRIINKIIE
ncbi:MAG: protein O-GlcNAcase [Romboutsia sp.]